MPQVVSLSWMNKDKLVPVGQLVLSDDPSRGETMAFRYDEQWVNSGFALGNDLPLTNAVLYPSSDALQVDPVLNARNGIFGFYCDHAPGKWAERLLRQAHLNDFKVDSFESSPDSWQIWTHAGHASGRFSALTLPVTHGFHSKFLPPLLECDRHGKPSKSLKNLTAAMETLQSGAAFREKEQLETLLLSALELGGTNPKCVVRLDKSETQWVVRHAASREAINSALWMAVTRELAQACGLNVVAGQLIGSRLYAERRFDRAEDGSPLLCLSAATLVHPAQTRERLLHPTPMTYLDVADILNRCGAEPSADLKELFSRLLFNCLTGNNRDRLDQFWFTPGQRGWKLLPLYAPCAQPPILSARFLSTPIRPGLNVADADAAVSVSRYFGVSTQTAKSMRLEFMHALASWKRIAQDCGADLVEIRRMQGAFF